MIVNNCKPSIKIKVTDTWPVEAPGGVGVGIVTCVLFDGSRQEARGLHGREFQSSERSLRCLASALQLALNNVSKHTRQVLAKRGFEWEMGGGTQSRLVGPS